MNDTAVCFSAVSKRYQRVAALVEVDLTVARGEFVGIVGENGAGKTTLIKALLDFCELDSGEIEIFGIPHRETAARARLAYLPERFVPPFYVTGADFLTYMAQLHRASADAQRIAEVCDILELEVSALSRAARGYSKGMQQKLGLAACLLSGKDLYVLDEPADGLDPKARALLKRALETLRAAGKTVLFASHALADVYEMCDRVLVLHRGRVRYTGTPRHLIAQYAARDFEHAFLSCIDGKVAA